MYNVHVPICAYQGVGALKFCVPEIGTWGVWSFPGDYSRYEDRPLLYACGLFSGVVTCPSVFLATVMISAAVYRLQTVRLTI